MDYQGTSFFDYDLEIEKIYHPENFDDLTLDEIEAIEKSIENEEQYEQK